MKIDIFSHILPEKYLKAYSKKSDKIAASVEVRSVAVTDLEVRFRLMDRYPDVLQVLTVSQPPLEKFVGPEDAAELAAIANDELAELVGRYPNRFIAGVACLPMNNIEAALKETDRAITQLGLKGVQIYSRVNGQPLDSPEFRPIFEKMAGYDLPIWLHPTMYDKLDMDMGVFSWPFETASAMYRLVMAGIFNDYPDIKIISHHCGSMVPFFEKRIEWVLALVPGRHRDIKQPLEHFRKFYNDTALYGSTPALMCAYEFFGAERMLYGTDAPLGPRFGMTQGTIDSIKRMAITDAEKEKILTGNAVNLLALAH